MKKLLFVSFFTLAFTVRTVSAIPPSHQILGDQFSIEHVNRDCPIIYDNDWWTDVPDAVYLWIKASRGECSLRGNIVSRDMWEWQNGYTFKIDEGLKDCKDLLAHARASGLKNIPDPTIGSNEALRRPESGKIEDTSYQRNPGSDLIVDEAMKASPTKPLLIFCGGPCTTVAVAYLTKPEIADRVIVFQIDGGAYNGKDAWSWQIVEQRFRFVNWARGYFWPQLGKWDTKKFDSLPQKPIFEAVRRYAYGGLANDNQWGDGAWIFWFFDPSCLSKIEVYNQIGLTVPADGVHVEAMQTEFFRTLMAPESESATTPPKER